MTLTLRIFTNEEDEYLVQANILGIKVSRMAIKLDKDYCTTLRRLVELGCVNEKVLQKIEKSHFYCEDENDYEMLSSGLTEEELKDEKARCRVFPKSECSFCED
jgi:hypothetical protein